MHDLSKFDSFLIDHEVYDQNELFWEGIILEIVGDLPHKIQWMNTLQNGEKWRMGNPMFTAYFPTLQRAVRIIQKDKKDTKSPSLRAWISDTVYIENDEETDIWELVIGIVLTQENIEASKYLIRQWIDENNSLASMKEMIASAKVL
ncbi:MAG: hypothetical protein MUE81_06055 [Thermoflexibacter sp.]|nr:hypothetical protein [Thermoflexibacter sp.]